ncbi:MAG TPA: hypothetical protein DCZ12_07050 [Gammaproteobacteria bacterium]|nr:hypothetical protein [Gammaproteobacteria bacterium]
MKRKSAYWTVVVVLLLVIVSSGFLIFKSHGEDNQSIVTTLRQDGNSPVANLHHSGHSAVLQKDIQDYMEQLSDDRRKQEELLNAIESLKFQKNQNDTQIQKQLKIIERLQVELEQHQ